MTISVALDGMLGHAFALRAAFGLPAQGVTALLGPSGAGKTTILRALAGLEHVRGTITCGGAIWQDDRTFVPPEARSVGYVFQGGGLLPHLTVGANLDYAAQRARPGSFDRAELIDRTGIGHLLNRQPRRLSGGEAQRAGIARALLSQPRLLLMDEPLSALDSKSRTDLVSWLETLFTDIAVPVLYVTHDHREAERLATETIRIRNGMLDGTEISTT